MTEVTYYTQLSFLSAVERQLDNNIQNEKSYVVGFSYKGPYSNFGEDHESNNALSKAGDIVEEIFQKERIPYRHSYSWPDGSLYYTVESILDYNSIVDSLSKVFAESEVKPKNIYENIPVSVVATIDGKEIEFSFTSDLNFIRKYYFNLEFYGKLYDDAVYYSKNKQYKLIIKLNWQFKDGKLFAFLKWET